MPHAGTFNNNVLTMSAGVAAMSEVFTSDVAEALHARGDALRLRLNSICEHHDVAVQVTGLGSLMNLHPVDGLLTRPADLARADETARELLYFDLLDRGFYMGRRGFMALTLVVSDGELDRFVDALDETLAVRRAVLQPRRRANAA